MNRNDNHCLNAAEIEEGNMNSRKQFGRTAAAYSISVRHATGAAAMCSGASSVTSPVWSCVTGWAWIT